MLTKLPPICIITINKDIIRIGDIKMKAIYTSPEFEEMLIESETIMDSEDPNYDSSEDDDDSVNSVWD
jgi:hypothetical protein